MSKELVDLGVDLRITQLLEEGIVRTTWPRIHAYGHRQLMEQLIPVAKKGPRPSALRVATVE
jgi:ribosomal protein L17